TSRCMLLHSTPRTLFHATVILVVLMSWHARPAAGQAVQLRSPRAYIGITLRDVDSETGRTIISSADCRTAKLRLSHLQHFPYAPCQLAETVRSSVCQSSAEPR